jgi:hypothetical protein
MTDEDAGPRVGSGFRCVHATGAWSPLDPHNAPVLQFDDLENAWLEFKRRIVDTNPGDPKTMTHDQLVDVLHASFFAGASVPIGLQVKGKMTPEILAHMMSQVRVGAARILQEFG